MASNSSEANLANDGDVAWRQDLKVTPAIKLLFEYCRSELHNQLSHLDLPKMGHLTRVTPCA